MSAGKCQFGDPLSAFLVCWLNTGGAGSVLLHLAAVQPGTRPSTSAQASRGMCVCGQNLHPGAGSYGPSPLLRGQGDLSGDRSFKELLGKWGGGSQAGQAPTCPVAHPPPSRKGPSRVPWHVTSCVLPPPPRPGSFEEGPRGASFSHLRGRPWARGTPLGPSRLCHPEMTRGDKDRVHKSSKWES